jgi:hypothetical protein
LGTASQLSSGARTPSSSSVARVFTGVAAGVCVRIDLVGVGHVRAVVALVAHAVRVRVHGAHVHGRAQVLAIGHAVQIAVAVVAGVALAVRVGVALGRVGCVQAIVRAVGHTVAVQIRAGAGTAARAAHRAAAAGAAHGRTAFAACGDPAGDLAP